MSALMPRPRGLDEDAQSAGAARDVREGEGEGAEALLARVDALLAGAQPGLLVSPDGTRTEIPSSVLEGLRSVAAAIASGRAVTVAPQDHELTTQEAADLLHVSRPHVIKLLEQGDLPFHRTSEQPGAHRRLRLQNVLDYRDRRRLMRRSKMRELTEMSQDVEGGYR